MARTIMISDEVYESLRRAKVGDESFSTLLHRRFGPRQTLERLQQFIAGGTGLDEVANIVESDLNARRESRLAGRRRARSRGSR